ncbi:MAG TPA: succinate dehydrogenase/fumarate reductase iron-sulfur subunit [Nitrospiraceae bacterium]|nr:succinate dehydrogenase/fumarate reductase iron-sulfur subunit [Nitrospiraceae bacterium]
MRLTFTIQRFNPEIDSIAHPQEIRLDVGRGMTVLDALIRIKNECDGSLALRYSCRSAICGSCAMTINGSEKLACRTSLRKELERHGRIAVAPMRHLPVIKDLVVDMTSFWEKIRDVHPWLASAARPSQGDLSARTKTQDHANPQFHNVDACIMCGACVAACTVHEVSKGFIGPAALAKADRFLSDPRESPSATRARLSSLQDEHGIWDCTRCNFCVEVCPKDVKPMEAIVRLRRASIERGLTKTGGARHILGFTDLVEQHGRLNEAVMPLKVVGFAPSALLHVLPLAIKMLFKGKIPNPFGHALPGLSHLQDFIRRVRRAMPPG